MALDFEFKSPEAFARAFKKIYDISPTEYRKIGLMYLRVIRNI
ncbi:AraC family transcriptional regulator [Clostridium botulinum]|nr:AraC family transcriptional regulator [Clostridium botulinum]